MNFHEYLKSLIKDSGLTQQAVADSLQMDKSYFSRMLNNKLDSMPTSKTLDSLSHFLICTTEERLELYRLAGKFPPELRESFCSSADQAKKIYLCIFAA